MRDDFILCPECGVTEHDPADIATAFCEVCETKLTLVMWTVEPHGVSEAFLVTPNGHRVALMTRARAQGISAALNTRAGRVAFEIARNG